MHTRSTYSSADVVHIPINNWTTALLKTAVTFTA
jgi:hypothetical protein